MATTCPERACGSSTPTSSLKTSRGCRGVATKAAASQPSLARLARPGTVLPSAAAASGGIRRRVRTSAGGWSSTWTVFAGASVTSVVESFVRSRQVRSRSRSGPPVDASAVRVGPLGAPPEQTCSGCCGRSRLRVTRGARRETLTSHRMRSVCSSARLRSRTTGPRPFSRAGRSSAAGDGRLQ